ncbi:hypothetical protein S40285_01072 [Stachybotrys chlorohalonatus IBT 40285]|uniref:Uncharacterized protein n=1 Tax=Stachybotrys chlorohalonatus (strain IBT 40285) TaxID=1283841 RepID=A0A084QKK5_STAC4|nr:hypothetical protein S40285_01072 [Stachybotrys chlorohalonata IBT 40285]
MAMGRADKKFDSDVSDSESVTTNGTRAPWFPPPPTAPIREKKRARIREAPQPIEDMPPLPPLPPAEAMPPPKRMENPFPLRKPVARSKSIRKTIMARIDGWWDLGLLEKRQTMLGSPASHRP